MGFSIPDHCFAGEGRRRWWIINKLLHILIKSKILIILYGSDAQASSLQLSSTCSLHARQNKPLHLQIPNYQNRFNIWWRLEYCNPFHQNSSLLCCAHEDSLHVFTLDPVELIFIERGWGARMGGGAFIFRLHGGKARLWDLTLGYMCMPIFPHVSIQRHALKYSIHN